MIQMTGNSLLTEAGKNLFVLLINAILKDEDESCCALAHTFVLHYVFQFLDIEMGRFWQRSLPVTCSLISA